MDVMILKCEKREAIRIKVEIDGDIVNYSKSFLAIYNNVKNDNSLLKMYNDYHNGVYVICETDVKENAVKFLEQFGEIVTIERVEVVAPIAYDYEYRNDLDTEFLEVDEL
jgi:hypothetical protein